MNTKTSLFVIFFEAITYFYVTLKSMFFFKKVNFNKNKTESKIDNSTQAFREMNLVLQPI